MRKSRKSVDLVVEELSSQLERKFPGLSFETIHQPGDGYDAWLRVYVTPDQKPRMQKIRYAAYELADDFDDKTSVAIMPMIREKEPVHG